MSRWKKVFDGWGGEREGEERQRFKDGLGALSEGLWWEDGRQESLEPKEKRLGKRFFFTAEGLDGKETDRRGGRSVGGMEEVPVEDTETVFLTGT